MAKTPLSFGHFECNRVKIEIAFNHIALRKANIIYNFGLSECSRVKLGVLKLNITAYEQTQLNCVCYFHFFDKFLAFRGASLTNIEKRTKMKMSEFLNLKVYPLTHCILFGLFHFYMCDESVCHFRVVGSILSLLFYF